MSEEVENASSVVPQSIMLGLVVNGAMGFAMMIAVLFCIGDFNAALNTNTGYPFMEIFLQGTRGSVVGAAFMSAVPVVVAIASLVGSIACSSRMLWSFARDHGVPCWRTLSKVSQSLHSLSTYLISILSTHTGQPKDNKTVMVNRSDGCHCNSFGLYQHWLCCCLQRHRRAHGLWSIFLLSDHCKHDAISTMHNWICLSRRH